MEILSQDNLSLKTYKRTMQLNITLDGSYTGYTRHDGLQWKSTDSLLTFTLGVQSLNGFCSRSLSEPLRDELKECLSCDWFLKTFCLQDKKPWPSKKYEDFYENVIIPKIRQKVVGKRYSFARKEWWILPDSSVVRFVRPEAEDSVLNQLVSEKILLEEHAVRMKNVATAFRFGSNTCRFVIWREDDIS